MRSNLKYGKNQKREDVKSHHYIISFDPRDAADNGLTVDKAQELGKGYSASFLFASCPLIAHTVNRLDICLTIRFNLAANTADRSSKGMFIYIFFINVLQLFQKLLAGKYLLRISKEKVQHFIFHCGKRQYFPVQTGILLRKMLQGQIYLSFYSFFSVTCFAATDRAAYPFGHDYCIFFLPQYTAIACLTKSAVPSPPALSILFLKRSSHTYISPNPLRIPFVHT